MTRHPAAISWDPAEAALEWTESATCPLHHLYSTSSWTLNQTWVLQSDRPEVYKKTVSVITLSREILLQTWIALTVSVNGGFWEQRLQVSDVWEAQLWSNMASVYPPDSGLFEFLFWKFNRTERGEKYVVWHGIKVKKCIKKITQIVILIEQLKIICKMLIVKSFFRL